MTRISFPGDVTCAKLGRKWWDEKKKIAQQPNYLLFLAISLDTLACPTFRCISAPSIWMSVLQ